jgi:uncharacterized protein
MSRPEATLSSLRACLAAVTLGLPGSLFSHLAAGAMQCDGRLSQAEQLICGNQELLSLDQALNDAYAATLAVVADTAALRKAQRVWLRVERDACTGFQCMYRVMHDRIGKLSTERITAQPALGQPLDMDTAKATCSAGRPVARCTALTARVTKFRLK